MIYFHVDWTAISDQPQIQAGSVQHRDTADQTVTWSSESAESALEKLMDSSLLFAVPESWIQQA